MIEQGLETAGLEPTEQDLDDLEKRQGTGAVKGRLYAF